MLVEINIIDKEYREFYDKNRGDYGKIDSLRREHRNAISKKLTSEQQKKFYETYDNRWRGRGQGRGMGPGMMGY